MATIKKLNESIKNTNTEKIVDIIKNKLSKSSYLTYEEDETYSDNSARIRYHFNDNLINQANAKMKDVLNRTLIDITIKDYSEDVFVNDDTKDIEINIYSMFDMFRDDWCESLSLNNVNENEIIDYLEEKLGDEALLDNAKNNNTWDESLEDDNYYHFDFLGDISKEEVADLISSGEETYATNEKDKKVWDSLTDEEKCLLVLDNDMGFHFDTTLDNDEVLAKVSEIQSRFNENLKEELGYKSPLDYIEDKFQEEGIKYELDWIDEGDYDVEFTILDTNNIDRADDIICNEVGYAYEVVRDKDGHKKAFKVATYQDVIDRLNENLKEDKNINKSSKGLNKSKKIAENKLQESKDFHNYKTQLEQAKTKDELVKVWNAFRKDYDSEMTPNEEKTLGELYKDLRKELTEDKQVTYVWKKDGDDHILTEKGKDKALITLSRMNSGFPWTIYKGDKEITLDTDSDKLSDIKSYILNNVDKILGKKLKEDLGEYCLIAKGRAWDSEAIDWENVKKVACGTYEEMKQELEKRRKKVADYYADFKRKNTNPWVRPDMQIEREGEDFVTIYYPLAIAKTTYQIVKNNENLKEGLYEFSKPDKKAIIQWWKDISKIEDDYVDVSNIDKALENDDDFFSWFSAMYDVLNDLRYNFIEKDDDKREYLTNLYRKGKRLYNKYALSQFNENLNEDDNKFNYNSEHKQYQYSKANIENEIKRLKDRMNIFIEDRDNAQSTLKNMKLDTDGQWEDDIQELEKEIKDYNKVIKEYSDKINYWELAIKQHHYTENLKEAKGKLEDALPELKEIINEHKNSIVEYGEALKQGNVNNPNYKDYTTRFVFDIYYFLKRRGFNIYKYIDENDLRDDYIKTLMKKALSECGINYNKEN